MGVLQYTPYEASTFNFCTFKIALDGYMQANGIKKDEEKYMSRNRLLELMGK